MPKTTQGDTYLRSDIWANVVGQVTQMPVVEGQSGGAGTSPVVAGTKAGKFDTFGGSAIPGSSFGAAFLTPSEKTGKEIRKVIARLG